MVKPSSAENLCFPHRCMDCMVRPRYGHREFALRGERKEAMEKILREFIERGWLEP